MNHLKKTIAATLAAGALLVTLTGCEATSPETACTVEDKDRSSTSKGASVYRVYTDCGIFTVEDALFLGIFNAADTYAAIEPGKTYQFVTYGYRMPLFSTFPNITKATEVTE